MDEKNIFAVPLPFFVAWICPEICGKINSTKEIRPNYQENDGSNPGFENTFDPLHIAGKTASEELSMDCPNEINLTYTDSLRSSR